MQFGNLKSPMFHDSSCTFKEPIRGETAHLGSNLTISYLDKVCIKVNLPETFMFLMQ